MIARLAARGSHNPKVARSTFAHRSVCAAHAEAFAFGRLVPAAPDRDPEPTAAFSWRVLVGWHILAPTRRLSPRPIYSRSRPVRSRSATGQRASHVSPGRRRGCLMPGHVFPATWPRGVTASTLDSESSDRGSNPREALRGASAAQAVGSSSSSERFAAAWFCHRLLLMPCASPPSRLVEPTSEPKRPLRHRHGHRNADKQTPRHTDTQTHRHTDTQTHGHTNTQTHRHKDTQRQTHKHTGTHAHRHTDAQKHGHTDTPTHRHTDTRTCKHTDTQLHRHTDTQTLGHTETQRRSHTDARTPRHPGT